jgi:two-component system chemotaxis response regulator CheY
MANVQNIPILIVDDYITMLKIMGNLLRQLGFQNIIEETNAFTALEKLHNSHFELIISDSDMGMMSGLSFLEKIRADQELEKIPFIMVTAEPKPEYVNATKEDTSSTYIVKPFNVSTLKTKIMTVLGDF